MQDNYLMKNYGAPAMTLVKGEGVYAWDQNGNRYLDAVSGLAVCGLGHCHPKVTQAIQTQAETLVHCSNLYGIAPQIELAEKLCKKSGMERVFFGNSGAEANEAAIKLARLYGNKKKVKVPTIIVVESAFHGRTMATLTATYGRKAQAGFEPLVRGFTRAVYNDIASVEEIIANNSDIVAIMVEPIQGEAGVRIPEATYLNQLRDICDQNELLLILDEIQTGNGRTGTYFAYQKNGIKPDIVTTAKGLANGIPIGACLARGVAAELYGPGSHGSTFGGNPMACSAANAVFDTIESENLTQRALELGNSIVNQLNDGLSKNPNVVEIRGQGLMIAVELSAPCGELVTMAAKQGLLINVTSQNVVRLLPPFIYTDENVATLTSTLIEIVQQWTLESAA